MAETEEVTICSLQPLEMILLNVTMEEDVLLRCHKNGSKTQVTTKFRRKKRLDINMCYRKFSHISRLTLL